MPRDNFTDATKKLLAGKVGYRCSNPFCRCATVGSNEDGSGIITIGQAAHITAAEVNGPRYDATLTSRERRAESNGIWLCCNHARMIDRDPDFFTVQLLEKWKRDAEKEANEKIQGINTRDLSFTLKIIYDDLQASYEAVEKVKSTDMNIVFPASMLFVPDEYENKIALISDQIGLDNASRIRKCFRAITEFKNITSEESKRYKKTLGRIADIQAIKYGYKLFEFYERIDEYDLKGLIETIGLIFNEKDAK